MLGSAAVMFRRLSFIVVLVTAVIAAGCGDDTESGDRAGAGSDVNQLLRDTFANVGKMKSATVDMKLSVESRAASDTVGARLSGAFESQGANRMPKFAFDAELTSAGQTVSGGATYTGQKGFITLQGTAYEVSGTVLKPFVASYEQALKSQQGQKGGPVLGIDFRKWLKDARNEGETKVGDADTIKLTGSADVAQVVADIDALAKRAASLPGAGGRLPQSLTPEQKQRVTEAIKAVKIEVYTGAEDKILRRLLVTADLKDAASKVDAALSLDLTFTKVGEEQEIEAPEDAQPFGELLKALDAAGLTNLGIGAGATEQPKDPSEMSNNVDKYADCIEDAGGDRAKARKCAEILTG
jgi:hypothetical protein